MAKRIMPYVSIDENKGVATLVVKDLDHKIRRYPLTEAGCVQAGKELFEAGCVRWLHSSSVDHADEYGFDHDVHELMGAGLQEAARRANAPRQNLVAKMLARCSKPDFQKTLTAAERRAFKIIQKEAEEET